MPLRRADLLPPEWPVERLAACFGLVSDTHLPERLSRLPAALFEVLRGVDLVLHAGDIGELRVLDELSRIAPVVVAPPGSVITQRPPRAAALPAGRVAVPSWVVVRDAWGRPRPGAAPGSATVR